jgi:hypothetical protein
VILAACAAADNPGDGRQYAIPFRQPSGAAKDKFIFISEKAVIPLDLFRYEIRPVLTEAHLDAMASTGVSSRHALARALRRAKERVFIAIGGPQGHEDSLTFAAPIRAPTVREGLRNGTQPPGHSTRAAGHGSPDLTCLYTLTGTRRKTAHVQAM